MFDVLKTLSGLVKTKKQPKERKSVDKKSEPDKKISTPSLSVSPIKESKKIDSGEAKALVEIQAKIALAEAKAKEILFEAKEEAYKIRNQAEGESRKKLETVEKREHVLEEGERRLLSTERDVQKRLSDVETLHKQWAEKLQKVADMTSEEARAFLLEEMKSRMRGELAKEIKEAQIKAEEEAEAKAREILVDAMRHGVTDYIAEYTVSVIKIQDEDMKGRIIGKEGRNIRAFETATGVDVDLDEEGVIRLSCFDPVRREIARVSLERLLKDGRVQPGRIEEIIEQVKKEIDRIMFEEGQKLCHAVGVYNLPSPIVALLGRFKYRFSYGQNMIAHTLEETKIGIAIAKEIGADVNIVRLGCLLHDIGKVITDKEGTHVELGVDLLKKYGLPQKVIDCVAQHHEDTPFTSSESVITYISDAISGGRPGARYENYDEYIKRLTSLEDIAKSHKGVRESFAFQAGRELRVLVDPGKVDDAASVIMAQEIKEEIEKKMTFPGQIKITVIRELRAVETAK